MSSFDDLRGLVSSPFHEKVKKYSSSLFEYFGLTSFFYYEIEESGSFSLFDSSLAWNEFYSAKKFYLIDPYFRHPRFFSSGIALLKDVHHKELKEMFDPGKERFNINAVLKIFQKTKKGVACFGFCSRGARETEVSHLLSHVSLLKLFSEKFKEDMPDLFNVMREERIDLRKLMGLSFYQNGFGEKEEGRKKEEFLEQLGILCPLSKKEEEIGEDLLEGFSASQIAQRFCLSKRTVEHHLERMKGKLDANSKGELVRKLRKMGF